MKGKSGRRPALSPGGTKVGFLRVWYKSSRTPQGLLSGTRTALFYLSARSRVRFCKAYLTVVVAACFALLCFALLCLLLIDDSLPASVEAALMSQCNG